MSATADRLREAIENAAFSKDPDQRDQVGCVIYSSLSAIGDGWNKTLDNSSMRIGSKATPWVAHAETVAIQNAIAAANREGTPPHDWKAYCTKEPCLHCLVQLANADVSEVHFIDAIPYEKSGRAWLKHFPSIRVYKEHSDQLPLLLRALGVRDNRSTEPVPSTPS